MLLTALSILILIPILDHFFGWFNLDTLQVLKAIWWSMVAFSAACIFFVIFFR